MPLYSIITVCDEKISLHEYITGMNYPHHPHHQVPHAHPVPFTNILHLERSETQVNVSSPLAMRQNLTTIYENL